MSDRITVEASQIIDAPIDRLWAEVADFNHVSVWHPDVTESQLETTNTGTAVEDPGVIRIIKLRNGTRVRERLIAIDPEKHRYVYSVLDGQFPLKDHLSSLSMRAVDAHRTEVTWNASFVPVDAPADALAEGVRSGVLELGLQGLADRVRRAA